MNWLSTTRCGMCGQDFFLRSGLQFWDKQNIQNIQNQIWYNINNLVTSCNIADHTLQFPFSHFSLCLAHSSQAYTGMEPTVELTAPLPFLCLCGKESCEPPTPQTCTSNACVAGIDKLTFSKRSNIWVAHCEHSKAHKSVFVHSNWCGNGCQRGIAKARSWWLAIWIPFFSIFQGWQCWNFSSGRYGAHCAVVSLLQRGSGSCSTRASRSSCRADECSCAGLLAAIVFYDLLCRILVGGADSISRDLSF